MPVTNGLYYTLYEGRSDDPLPVLLLHGAGFHQQFWPAEIRRLPGRKVIALDLPGHGRSLTSGKQSIAAFSAEVAHLLETLEIYQAVLVGHGMGGAVALNLAVQNPERVAGLGLISTGAWLNVNPDLLDLLASPSSASQALHFLQEQSFTPHSRAALVEQTGRWLRETRSSVIFNDWRACAQFDLRPEIHHINVPALVLVGQHDRLTPVALAHHLAGSMPLSRLKVVPNAGHMLPLEAPAETAAEIHLFLNGLVDWITHNPQMYLQARQKVKAPQKFDPFKSA